MKQEFLERTGLKELSDTRWLYINDVYMATSEDIDKDTFCKDWQKHGDSVIIDDLWHELDELKTKMFRWKREREAFANMLLEKANQYNDAEFYNEAVNLIGQKAVIETKIEFNLPMWDKDLAYIKANLK